MAAAHPTGRYTPPSSAEEAVARLEAADVPAEIKAVAHKLQRHGHEAVLVGGAVRDSLLGLPVGDWDLATSATPQEVQDLFRHTIPTGIEHGTVTVMVPNFHAADPPRVGVEVTTFRGEDDYVDGRRPQSVTFHRDLHEDLARRDFTINAFAWDPVNHAFNDPFGGLSGLQNGLIRAVGDPDARFGEDGLRTMRAVRLCATRDLTLEPATEAAIEPALGVLDKVSRERVRVELEKLLRALTPSQGLLPMVRTKMWNHVLAPLPEDELHRAIVAVDRMAPHFEPRLARLLWPLARTGDAGRTQIAAVVDALRPSRAQRAEILALTSPATEALDDARTAPEIRRAAASLGREHIEAAIAVLDFPEERAQAVFEAIEDAPLTTAELPLKGRDLIEAGIVQPGPIVGQLLRALLDRVLEDPTQATRDNLLTRAPTVVQTLSE